jgi:hypothetical protein
LHWISASWTPPSWRQARSEAHHEYGYLRTTLTGKFNGNLIFRRGFDTAKYFICPTADQNQFCSDTDRNKRIGELVGQLYTQNDNIKDSFPSKAFDLAGSDSTAIDKNIHDVEVQADKLIRELRKANASNIIAALSRSDSLYNKSQSLDGAVDMVDLYVAFVFPQSLATNDELRALLFGNSRLIDGEEIKDSLMRSPERNPVAGLRGNIRGRANTLFSMIDGILRELEKQDRHEVQPLVEINLIRLKHLEALHPPRKTPQS